MTNLTNRPVYQKSERSLKPATPKQRRHWDRLVKLVGCIVGPVGCYGRITIHHCLTGAGGRKNHDLVLPLCWNHHLGPDGINGGVISRREWEERYGSEQQLMEACHERLRCAERSQDQAGGGDRENGPTVPPKADG
jgi:hypothetical protein